MINSLPTELILRITEFMEDSTLLAMAHVNMRLRAIAQQESKVALNVGTKLNMIVKADKVKFMQDGDDNDQILYDYIRSELEDYGTITRYMGLRRKGDRVVGSRYPLVLQLHPAGNLDSKLSVLYFEVTIVAREGDYSNLPMRIGLTNQNYSHIHPPGSKKNSAGYVSTDGHVAIAQDYEELFQFASPWGVGDTVGCGYSRYATDHGTIFFTLNGQWVGDSPYRISDCQIKYRNVWHASFSSSGPTSIEFNLGKSPFKYDLRNSHFTNMPKLLNEHVYCKPRMLPNVLRAESDPYNHPTVDPDGCLVSFPSNGIGSVVARSVHSNLSINSLNTTSKFSYFEVKITRCMDPLRNSFLSIGLASNPYSPFHHIGWDYSSVGFHRY
jgi:hypothetical protein